MPCIPMHDCSVYLYSRIDLYILYHSLVPRYVLASGVVQGGIQEDDRMYQYLGTLASH